MNLLLFGILLGMGAAIPVGPVNLEIIRRNLHFGTHHGVVIGLGACIADLTYLILLCVGALTLLQYPDVMRVIGFAGSIVLAWFGISAFRSKVADTIQQKAFPTLWKNSMDGYLITMINPFTILFWASVSSQFSMATYQNTHAIPLAGSGVIIGTVGWVLFLNVILHFTKHRLNPNVMKWLNYSGGVILLGFAVTGLVRAFYL